MITKQPNLLLIYVGERFSIAMFPFYWSLINAQCHSYIDDDSFVGQRGFLPRWEASLFNLLRPNNHTILLVQ